MPEIFNVILVSVSRLLFSSPAFVKMAESSLSEVRQVQDSSGAMCSHTSVGSSLLDPFREVPVSENINFSSLSLVCDIAESVDDESSVSGSPVDTLLSSTSPRVTGTPQSSKLPHGSGLGISGLTRKDGSGPFDGLGIVSIKSSPWRNDDLPRSEMLHLGDGIDQSDFIHGFSQPSSLSSSSSTYDDSSESEDLDPSLLVGTGDGISDVFLQETFFTFTQDPFHQFCHSTVVSSSSIPGCDNSNNSWSELGHEPESGSMSDLLMYTSTHPVNEPQRLNHHRRRIPKLKTNFSSATISSELKRLSNAVFPKSNWRNRSSSWPASTPGNTAAPRTHCKWRL